MQTGELNSNSRSIVGEVSEHAETTNQGSSESGYIGVMENVVMLGAQVNVITVDLVSKLRVNVLPTTVKLENYCGNPIAVVGKCYCKCTLKSGRSGMVDFQVVTNTKNTPSTWFTYNKNVCVCQL
ncbi:hypothetical protein PR048_012357 [Dryococelus australis]|uniref:Uncharacterized protein n=1 Tax=Dryococelus australis TaxID=614101 RepID=A0ABQ9HQG0_9NEOP|nr:hypothetical protein PR048_012357 [Dryococelus australis]